MDFNHSFTDTVQSCKNTADASARFLQDTWNHPDCRLRQAAVVADGALVGGLKTTADRLINHPEETAMQVSGATSLMLAVGLLPVEIPVVAAGLAVTGTIFTGKYVYDLGQQLAGDHQFQSALTNAWNKSDSKTLSSSCAAAEQTLGKDTFDFALATMCGAGGYKLGAGLRSVLSRPGAKFALASGASDTFFLPTRAGQDSFFAMKGSAVEIAPKWMPRLTSLLDQLRTFKGQTADELGLNETRLKMINRDLIRLSQTDEPISVRTAQKLRDADSNFRSLVKTVRQDIEQGRQAFEDGSMTEAQENRYIGKQTMIDEILADRLRGYGWDGRTNGMIDRVSGTERGDGMQVQARVTNQISNVLNGRLSGHGEALSELVKSGLTDAQARLRLRNWRGIPMQANSSADMAGGDYLLVNKETGEYYPLDVTLRGINMKPVSIVETQATNPNLRFAADKTVPRERAPWTIGAVDENVYDARGDWQTVRELEQQQLARILGTTLATPSPLNVLDIPLPSNFAQHPTITLSELWQFKDQLQSQGMNEWAKVVSKAMESVWIENKGRNSIPKCWHNVIYPEPSSH